MSQRLKIFLLSWFTPGLGYLQNEDRKSFYKTIAIFFGVIVLSIALRLFISFWGLLLVLTSLVAIYFFTAVHAALRANAAQQKTRIKAPGFLKLLFTLCFVLITGLSFANRRTVMGFDVMSMAVPVMSPTVLQEERFLIDTWAYKKSLPKRGDIVAHSFTGQQGLYLNRIIAIGGDRIEIKGGVVFINEQPLNEKYVLPANATKPQSKDMKAVSILPGHYFVMGDNRDESFGDSRFSGQITIENIVGKTTDIISSPDRTRVGTTLQ